LRSAKGVVAYLTDSADLGLDRTLVLDLFDDTASAGEQLARIKDTLDTLLRERRDEARPVADLLIYYVGHGHTDDQGHLSLLVRRSRRGMEAETGIRAPDLARVLKLAAPQQRRVVILDCCFSEAAARDFIGQSAALDQAVAATAVKDLHDDQPQRGTLLLCSSPVGEVSMGPPNAERTLFTGAVLEVLGHGVEGAPSALSFADLRDAAYGRMVDHFGANAPRPILHQANAAHGDLTHTPAFPNRSERRWQDEEAKERGKKEEDDRRQMGEERRRQETEAERRAFPFPESHLGARLTRRRVVALGGLAAAGAVSVVAAPSVLRYLSRPSVRSVEFEIVTVDERGAHNPPKKSEASVFAERLGPGDDLEMVAIPRGSFTMGSAMDELARQPNEGPQHHVTLSPFFMSASPVTQAQWLAVVTAHPARIARNLNPNPSFFKGIGLPVETIAWNQAEEFCQRLAAVSGRRYRLPTESEWEYACRAGSVGPFNVGPTITPELANYCGSGGAVCGDNDGESIAADEYGGVQYAAGAYGQGPGGIFRGTTTRAGTFPRNRFGLYDMHGNVWEYCLDTAAGDYDDAPPDGRANLSGQPGASACFPFAGRV
jgi:formylglycine-generating enzyme required for sulfatase activity